MTGAVPEAGGPAGAGPKRDLTMADLIAEAGRFAEIQNTRVEPALFGVTDGKAVGTHLERRFSEHLADRYRWSAGSAAAGLDFPELGVDLKVTSVRQPQSSSPFRNAGQKIYGLGYGLLIFVYEKTDDSDDRVARLLIAHAVYVERERTGDYQTTRGIRDILDREGNANDLVAFFHDRNLPVDDLGARNLAETVLGKRPNLGVLTISNALQWRLQFSRALQQADDLSGVVRIR